MAIYVIGMKDVYIDKVTAVAPNRQCKKEQAQNHDLQANGHGKTLVFVSLVPGDFEAQRASSIVIEKGSPHPRMRRHGRRRLLSVLWSVPLIRRHLRIGCTVFGGSLGRQHELGH